MTTNPPSVPVSALAPAVRERVYLGERIAKEMAAGKRAAKAELRHALAANARANGWGQFPNAKTGRMEWRRITEREALRYKRSRLGALPLHEVARLAELEWSGA